MKILILFSVAALLLAYSKDDHGQVPELRFDGVHQSDQDGDSWSYLRFYHDGTVIKVTSTSRPAKIERWFTKEHEGVSVGKVTLDGSRLSFSCVSDSGTIEYAGEILDHRIQLDSHSHINDHRASRVYTFVESSKANR